MLKKEDVLELIKSYKEHDDESAEVIYEHRFDALANSIVKLSNEGVIIKVHSIERVQNINKDTQDI